MDRLKLSCSGRRETSPFCHHGMFLPFWNDGEMKGGTGYGGRPSFNKNDGDSPLELFGKPVVCVKPIWCVDPVVVVTCENERAKLARITVLSPKLYARPIRGPKPQNHESASVRLPWRPGPVPA